MVEVAKLADPSHLIEVEVEAYIGNRDRELNQMGD
jgi:hypothetical protein